MVEYWYLAASRWSLNRPQYDWENTASISCLDIILINGFCSNNKYYDRKLFSIAVVCNK